MSKIATYVVALGSAVAIGFGAHGVANAQPTLNSTTQSHISAFDPVSLSAVDRHELQQWLADMEVPAGKESCDELYRVQSARCSVIPLPQGRAACFAAAAATYAACLAAG
ncbi:hypothetical protein [Nocardia asiatica]|uniref:hypothetical protein n=1 Tax=Nocardia asiatica TaxID=209252 RepID=UPI00245722DC|nr:hypothetical protein [Nocardia asiatica]